MSWLVSAKQYIPAVIGEPFGGGYFAGYISHTADGNPTHALIVAPRATGATGTGYTLTTALQWKTSDTTTTGTTSEFDGLANTASIVSAGIANHPAAQFCVNLAIGGFTDWYFPSRAELDIAYFNLKPTSTLNNPAFGVNSYSVPARSINNTRNYPPQTYALIFKDPGGEQSFALNFHWSSTQFSASNANHLSFADGNRGANTKTSTIFSTRAFRRIAL